MNSKTPTNYEITILRHKLLHQIERVKSVLDALSSIDGNEKPDNDVDAAGGSNLLQNIGQIRALERWKSTYFFNRVHATFATSVAPVGRSVRHFRILCITAADQTLLSTRVSDLAAYYRNIVFTNFNLPTSAFRTTICYTLDL